MVERAPDTLAVDSHRFGIGGRPEVISLSVQAPVGAVERRGRHDHRGINANRGCLSVRYTGISIPQPNRIGLQS